MIRASIVLLAVASIHLLPVPRCVADEGQTARQQFPPHLLPLVDDLQSQLRLAYGSTRPILQDRVQYTLYVVAAWQRSGRTPSDVELLEAWLRESIRRSTPGRNEPMSAVPSFSTPSAVAAAVGDVSGAADDAASQESDAVSPHESPVVEQREPPLPLVLTMPNEQLETNSGTLLAETPGPPRSVDVPAHAVDPLRPLGGGNSRPTVAPAPAADAGRRLAAESSIVRTEASGTVPIRVPVPVAHAASGLAGKTGNPPEKLDERVDARSSVESRVTSLERRAVRGPNLVDAGIEPRYAPLVVAEVVAQAAQQTVRKSQVPPHRVSIDLNLREYAARLAGHRLGVRRLEARLVQVDEMTVEHLAVLVGELESLAGQAAFLTLYADILSADVTSAYGQPAPTRDAVQALHGMIRSRRAVASKETPHSRRGGQDLDRLDKLADRLSRIASGAVGEAGLP